MTCHEPERRREYRLGHDKLACKPDWQLLRCDRPCPRTTNEWLPYTENGNQDEEAAKNGRMNGELCAGLKEVFGRITAIETGALESGASMTSAAELASFHTLQRRVPGVEEGRHLFVFRSRDGAWAGLRWREERFRFRRASLVGFSLDIGATMALSALACEPDGGGDCCAWKGMRGNYRIDEPGRKSRGT